MIGLMGGVNLYAYVEGNSLSRSDPTGEFAILLPFVPVVVGAGTRLVLQRLAQLAVVGVVGAIGDAMNDESSGSGSDAGADSRSQCDDEECDPPAGTMCSVFHIDSTPHTTRDIDGKNLGKLPYHVHIFRMNKAPQGCFWNESTALNYTPVSAKPCSSYPSWVAQHGR